MFDEPTIADAILDRIIDNAHRVALEGDSMRKKKAASPWTNAERAKRILSEFNQATEKPPPRHCPGFSETAVRQLLKPLSRFREYAVD